MDHQTGEYFELNKLAPSKFNRVMAETKAIQEKMKDVFGQAIKDKSVLVTYQNEKTDDFDEKKVKLIEMEKERPPFFSSNLMQKTRSKDKSSSTTVRPSGLG